MVQKIRQAYGTWSSLLSPKMMSGSTRLNDVQWDANGETIIWSERRAGLGILSAQAFPDSHRDLTDGATPVSARVGYGGGEFTAGDDFVVFCSSGRLYRHALSDGLPQPITPVMGACASPTLSNDGRWIAYVNSYEEQDRVLVVDSAGTLLPRILASGTDFVMQPSWHPQGTHLAYIAWNHPNMAWNGSQLRLVTLAYDKGGVPYNAIEETLIGDEHTAIFQPSFSPDGRYLAYISDASGWGHLYLYDLAEGTHQQLTHGETEHSTPAWVQGLRQYGWTGDSRSLYYIRNDKGFMSVWRYDLLTQAHSRLDPLRDYTSFKQISVSAKGEHIALIAGASHIPSRIITYSASAGVRVVRRATMERLAPNKLAIAEAITWDGHDGETVHGLYYPPTHPNYEGIGTPPLVVLVHGGPTSQRNADYDEQVQFFATRGYAVLQVNHRGSTGYGKAYMNKHRHHWGVYDVEDARTGALHLVHQGLADRHKLIIMGSSAGGYTVLQTLVDYPNVFKVGVNSYGVANQFTLALDTHKFEARYSDWLLGELPESADRWRDRSPLFGAHKIRDAMIIFQGLDDAVVPPSQSEAIVAALRKNGVPHEYYTYAGEGHGFSKPETIEAVYTKLERFLLQYVLYV